MYWNALLQEQIWAADQSQYDMLEHINFDQDENWKMYVNRSSLNLPENEPLSY